MDRFYGRIADRLLYLRSPMKSHCLLALGLAGLCTGLFAAEPPLFQSNDRVAFVGGTYVERDRHFGSLETVLQLAVGPEIKGLTFRNLGWSGDSVFSDSRSYFGPPQEGRQRLEKNLAEIHPGVVFLWYGSEVALSIEDSWTGETVLGDKIAEHGNFDSDLAFFISGYGALIDLTRSAAGEALREIILVSPPPFENLGAPLPDQTENNHRLARVRDAIRNLATQKKTRFVDLFAALGGDTSNLKKANPPLTDDGIHYTQTGHDIIAKALAKQLGYPELQLSLSDSLASAGLRSAIIEKDRLFFHRWRPANETYLFLFRKHEQGQNAQEIPQFDPLIDSQQKKIDTAKSLAFSEKP